MGSISDRFAAAMSSALRLAGLW